MKMYIYDPQNSTYVHDVTIISVCETEGSIICDGTKYRYWVVWSQQEMEWIIVRKEAMITKS